MEAICRDDKYGRTTFRRFVVGRVRDVRMETFEPHLNRMALVGYGLQADPFPAVDKDLLLSQIDAQRVDGWVDPADIKRVQRSISPERHVHRNQGWRWDTSTLTSRGCLIQVLVKVLQRVANLRMQQLAGGDSAQYAAQPLDPQLLKRI